MHQLLPLLGLLLQLAAALRREAVEARAAVVLGDRPVGIDPAAILEAVERGIERPLLDLQKGVGALLDQPRDGVAVRRRRAAASAAPACRASPGAGRRTRHSVGLSWQGHGLDLALRMSGGTRTE